MALTNNMFFQSSGVTSSLAFKDLTRLESLAVAVEEVARRGEKSE